MYFAKFMNSREVENIIQYLSVFRFFFLVQIAQNVLNKIKNETHLMM